MKSLKDIEHKITQFNVNPRSEMRSKVLDEALEIQRSQDQKSISDTNIWRTIMTNRKAQFTAATAAVLIIFLCLQIPGIFVTPAYALQDTIDAYSSIRWIHVKEFTMVGEEKWDSETWIECDVSGKPERFRHQAYQVSTSNQTGPITTVNDGHGTDVWIIKKKVCIRVASQPYFDAIQHMQWDITQADPKLLCEQWQQQHQRGEIQLDINEPARKEESIVVTNISGGNKKLLFVDQATRLVKKMEIYQHHPDDRDTLVRSIEFLDYNQEIDSGMFSLKDELPEDVIYVDQSDKVIGLVQGEMTDEQVAREVTRQFFQAFVDKDYEKAGLLWGGKPDFLVKELIPEGVRVLRVTSVGPAHREGDSNALVSSCEVLVEAGGIKLTYDAHMVRIRPISSDPVRWVVNGIGSQIKPPADYLAGTIKLSQVDADLNPVTYDGLKTGDFMQKWLLLEPIRHEVEGRSHFPVDKAFKDEFVSDQINVQEFEPDVTIDGNTHRWLLLESDQGKINLAHKYEGNFMTTYAWAQIDMPNEQRGFLGIGSDDAVKVWLNGEIVHENWTSRGIVIDNDRIPVTFKKGMNQLVIKIQNHLLGWGFCCRLIEE